MKRWFLILAAALPVAAFAGPAEVPDLLVLLSQAEEARVRQNNQKWLDEHLKSAKRHRLVRVDPGVLLSSDRFRITLFDDRTMLLEVLERDLHGSDAQPYYFQWTGSVATPPFSAEDLLAMNPHIGSLETAKFLHNAILEISIFGSRYLKDLATDGSWPVPHDHVGDDCSCPPSDAVPGTAPFYAIRADFTDPEHAFSYRIRPIEQDPQYHVLVEVDPASYSESNLAM